jgi:hypothetical protein
MKLTNLMRTAMARPKAKFTETDMKRAVKGALAAGLVAFSVTITTDGSTQVTVGPGVGKGSASSPLTDGPEEENLWAKKLD